MDPAASMVLLTHLLTERPETRARLAERLGPELPRAVRGSNVLPAGLVSAALETQDPHLMAAVTSAGHMTPHQIAELLARGVPGLAALRMIRRTAPSSSGAYGEGVRTLARLVGARLGADPAAWGRLVRLLPGHDGTLPQLLARAAGHRDPAPGPEGTAPADHRAAGEGDPGERDADDRTVADQSAVVPSAVVRSAAVRTADTAAADRTGGTSLPGPVVPPAPARFAADLRHLLTLLPPARLAELLPYLHHRTVTDLVSVGVPVPREYVEDTVARATHRGRITLARARWGRPDLHAALLACEDAEISAAVYLNPRASVAMRCRVMAAADRVPLHPDVVARVRSDWADSVRLPALWSGDPVLTRAALMNRYGATRPLAECVGAWERGGTAELTPLFRGVFTGFQSSGSAGRPRPLRMPLFRSVLGVALMRLWERHGPGAAAALVAELPERPAWTRAWTDLMDRPDGLDTLRAQVAGQTGTRRFLERIRARPRRVWPLVEAPDVDVAAVAAAHRRTALSSGALELAAAHPWLPADAGSLGADRAAWPAGVDAPPRYLPPYEGWWPGRATVAAEVKAGRIGPDEVLRNRPAVQALGAVARADTLAGAAFAHRLRAGLAALVDEHLGDDIEARVIALRHLPDFAGTVEELLATAAAAAGVTGRQVA